ILPDTFESVSNLIDNRYLIASILTKNENEEEDNDNSEYTTGIIDIITKQIILPFEYKQREIDTYYEVFDIPTSLEKKFDIFQFTKNISRTQEDVRFLIYHKEKHQWLLPEHFFFNEVEYFPKKGEFVVKLIEKKEKLVIDTFGNVVKKMLPSAYPNVSPEYVNGKLFYILRENNLNALADSNYQLIFPYTATTIRSMKHHAQQKKEVYFLVGNQIYEVFSKMTYTLPFEPEAGYYPEAGKLWLSHNGKLGYYSLLENQWITEPSDISLIDWLADKKIAKIKQKDKIYFINERGECVGEEPKVYDKL
ncbi:MAG: hypothetical protein ACKVTZ_19075, partial [Bacteroidia bacterium]